MNDNADQLLATGRGLFYTGKFAEAERELKKLIALDASLADAWFMLGMTYRSLARQPPAVDACREAVRLDASHAAAHNLLGILLAEMRRFAEAVEEFKRALALNPKNADTHFNLGLALLREQRMAEAVEAWRLAIAMRPMHAGAQLMLRQYAPAAPISPATTASIVGAGAPEMQKSETETEARLQLAREAFDRGDLAAAEVACRESLKRDPGHARALQHLGVILLSCRPVSGSRGRVTERSCQGAKQCRLSLHTRMCAREIGEPSGGDGAFSGSTAVATRLRLGPHHARRDTGGL